MSSDFLCEVCRKAGRRRMGTCVPEGWYFAEATIDTEVGTCAETAEDTLMIGVCSDACRDQFWKKGPGRLDLVTGAATETVSP